jgi:hypothetical protein
MYAMKTALLAFTLAVVTAGSLIQAEAQSAPPAASAPAGEPKTKTKPKSETGQPAGVPFNGKIAAVNLSAQTLTLTGKSQRVVKVTPQTKILRNGQPATLADAKVGEPVGGYAKKTEQGILEASSLRLGPKPPSDKDSKPAAGNRKPKTSPPAE